MGEPVNPPPSYREETHRLAAAIVESVRNDEEMPLGFEPFHVDWEDKAYETKDVEQLAFRFAQEIELLREQINAARVAARRLSDHVSDLGMAADDNNPDVMATAGPIGAAEADLWSALGMEGAPCATS